MSSANRTVDRRGRLLRLETGEATSYSLSLCKNTNSRLLALFNNSLTDKASILNAADSKKCDIFLDISC